MKKFDWEAYHKELEEDLRLNRLYSLERKVDKVINKLDEVIDWIIKQEETNGSKCNNG